MRLAVTGSSKGVSYSAVAHALDEAVHGGAQIECLLVGACGAVDALITLNTAAQIVGLDRVRRHLLAKLHRTEALCRMQPPPYIYASADKVEELPEGQSYYGGRFVATVQGVVGTGATPSDAVNRALEHLHYRRDPREWLAVQRKRRAAR